MPSAVALAKTTATLTITPTAAVMRIQLRKLPSASKPYRRMLCTPLSRGRGVRN